MGFSKIVGQSRAVSLLTRELSSGRVAESYLFVGPRGVGKRRSALEFAKALNCRNSTGVLSDKDIAQNNDLSLTTLALCHSTTLFKSDSCDSCSSCRKVDAGVHPDILLLDFESQARLLELNEEEKIRQKDFQIDAIRILIAQSHLSPLEGRKKVFIIDGAELLNSASANALLKVLEESAKQTCWILLAVSLERVIPTIRSRCRKISFAPLSPTALETLLFQALPGKDPRAEKVKQISEICDGSLSIAFSLLDKDSLELAEMASEVVDSAAGNSEAGENSVPAHLLALSSRILAESKRGHSKKRADQFLKILALQMARCLRLNPHPVFAENLEAVLQSQEDLRRNISPQLVLDALLLSLTPSACPSPSRGEDSLPHLSLSK